MKARFIELVEGGNMSEAVGEVPVLLTMILLVLSGVLLCPVYLEISVLALNSQFMHNILIHNSTSLAEFSS